MTSSSRTSACRTSGGGIPGGGSGSSAPPPNWSRSVATTRSAWRTSARPRASRGQRRGADRVRHHRARRRLQHPPAVHDRGPRRRGLGPQRNQVLHLGRRWRRSHPGRGANRHGHEDRPRPAVAVPGAAGRPRPDRAAAAGGCGPARASVHAVLRRGAGRRGPAGRGRERRRHAGVPRPEPGADHRRGDLCRDRPLRTGPGRGLRPGPGRLGRPQLPPTAACSSFTGRASSATGSGRCPATETGTR